MPSPRTTSRPVGLLLAAWLIAGCSEPVPVVGPTPPDSVVVMPYFVGSKRTADDAAELMLAEIAANERMLGRAILPARIIRIQLLRKNEMYPQKHLDGTFSRGGGIAPTGGPGWMVEAVGTWFAVDPQTGKLDSLGMHGWHLWDDAGGEGWGWLPCWERYPEPGDEMDGSCQ
jgi:hypothetical protein